MRIIIIGEYSSFSKNLSAGFRALGHQCFVFSWGDDFKKIKQDGDGYTLTVTMAKNPSVLDKIIYRFRCFMSFFRLKSTVKKIKKEGKWDVVLLINATFLKKHFWENNFTKEMVFDLIKEPENLFLSACGGDVPFVDYWNNQNWKNKEHVSNLQRIFLSKKSICFFKYYSSFIHKVIPVMFDYAEAWRNSDYAKSFLVLPTIPLPVNTGKYKCNNKIDGKIVVFHGIIRPKAKGTRYIVAAMERLQENYPDKVECIAKGGMPLDEYLEVLDRTNILIDQTYASSSGMNALYALAMGKVLLGGNEPQNAIEFNYPDIPIVNIRPDSDQIYIELEKLILQPERIQQLSIQGRKYVESVHDCRIVAQKYIETFINNGIKL